MKKTKIFVKNSRIAYGVPDFSETLKPNQVFFQYKNNILQGPVVVIKNPCYHAGNKKFIEIFKKKKLREKSQEKILRNFQ